MKKSELKLDCGDLPKEYNCENGLKVSLIDNYAKACNVSKVQANALSEFFIRSVVNTSLEKSRISRYYSIKKDGNIVASFDVLYCEKEKFKSNNLVINKNKRPKKESEVCVSHSEFINHLKLNVFDIGSDRVYLGRLIKEMIED